MSDDVTSAATSATEPHAVDNSDECSTNASSGENLTSINRLNLTLENFDQDDFVPENCPYVLTSPRSIEACKIVGIRVRKFFPMNIFHKYIF